MHPFLNAGKKKKQFHLNWLIEGQTKDIIKFMEQCRFGNPKSKSNL